MITEAACPVCGYDPNPPVKKLTDEELRQQRLLNIFQKNLQNSWWLTETEYACRWLKEIGINPSSILEIGCGDGRWIYGIKKTWPEVHYTGIDKIAEHIELNKERMPEHEWVYSNILAQPYGYFDLIMMMGTLNPGLKAEEQDAITAWIKNCRPQDIVIAFDVNNSGILPHTQLAPQYSINKSMLVPKEQCGPTQNVMIWRYKRCRE